MLSGGCPHPPVAPVPARDGQRQRKEKQRQCDDHPDDLRTIRHGTAVEGIAEGPSVPEGKAKSEQAPIRRPPFSAEGHCTRAHPGAFLFGPCTARFSFGKTDKGSRRAPHGGERRSAQAHGVGAEVPLGCKGAGAVFAVHGNGAERTLRRRHGGASRWTSPPWPGRPIHAPRMLTDPPATAAWTCTGVRPARGRVLRWEWCGAGCPPPPGPGW